MNRIRLTDVHLDKRVVIFLLPVVFLLGSCKDASVYFGWEDSYRTVIKSKNGKYVSADESNGHQLFVNRNEVREWETFIMIDLGHDTVLLKTSSDKYVQSDSSRNGLLLASGTLIRQASHFKITNLPSGLTLIQDYRGNYVRIDPKERLIADSVNTELAVEFTFDKNFISTPRIYLDHHLTYLISGLLLTLISIFLFPNKTNNTICFCVSQPIGEIAISIC